VEPFGTWRDNAHAALIASVIANVNRGKNHKAYELADFMLVDRESSRVRQTTQTLKALRAIGKRKAK
jgi:hypothetical protein